VISDTETSLKLLANFPDYENWQDKSVINQPSSSMGPYSKQYNKIRCHNCGEAGHKSTYCQEDPLAEEERNKLLAEDPHYNQQNMTVLCFKCNHYGHYANVCPSKGKLAKDDDVEMVVIPDPAPWEIPVIMPPAVEDLSKIADKSPLPGPLGTQAMQKLTGCRIEDLPISLEQVYKSLHVFLLTAPLKQA